MPEKSKKKQSMEISSNDALPVLYIDNLFAAHRKDGIVLIKLLTQLPNGLFEQARLIVEKDKLKGMIDVLCNNINYYPAKPK